MCCWPARWRCGAAAGVEDPGQARWIRRARRARAPRSCRFSQPEAWRARAEAPAQGQLASARACGSSTASRAGADRACRCSSAAWCSPFRSMSRRTSMSRRCVRACARPPLQHGTPTLMKMGSCVTGAEADDSWLTGHLRHMAQREREFTAWHAEHGAVALRVSFTRRVS